MNSKSTLTAKLMYAYPHIFKRQFYFLLVLIASVLSIPLRPSVLENLEQLATNHPAGYKYLYLADISIFNWRVFEALLFWIPLNARTGAHDHENVFNRGRVIEGCLEEQHFRVIDTKIKLTTAREINAGGWLTGGFRTAPFQIHEFVGCSEETAIALSMYFPGRDY